MRPLPSSLFAVPPRCSLPTPVDIPHSFSPSTSHLHPLPYNSSLIDPPVLLPPPKHMISPPLPQAQSPSRLASDTLASSVPLLASPSHRPTLTGSPHPPRYSIFTLSTQWPSPPNLIPFPCCSWKSS
ncbi:hypothetical protein AMTR_s00007p00256530 [Amborella trichopoda]|uniref:Uncharacterized protein n=1 Tax=Amborella trichopoda TaxID=13333 RepID=W1PEK6_AMBTC|nr:hypothetical protein AMTR_s00007p00256530 [Amborella trichopoda]